MNCCSNTVEIDELKSPVVVQFRDVTAAAYRIKKGVRETPLEVRLAIIIINKNYIHVF